MTKQQARIRAKTELGPNSDVRHSPKSWNPNYKCQIGLVKGVAGFAFFAIEANGETWDQAFAMLERKLYGQGVRLLDSELEELLKFELSSGTRAILERAREDLEYRIKRREEQRRGLK